MTSQQARTFLPRVTQRLVLYAPLALFAAVLTLITLAALWRHGPDVSSNAAGVVGGGLLGLIVNPQDGELPGTEHRVLNGIRDALIVASIAVCVVTGLSLILHSTDPQYDAKTLAGALVAALAALAGITINLSRLTPDLQLSAKPATKDSLAQEKR